MLIVYKVVEMRVNHDTKDSYVFKTARGTTRAIAKNPDIENNNQALLGRMSPIGKLTHLFLGYNIVDSDGVVMRKFKFLSLYPQKAKIIIQAIYPRYFYLKEEIQDSFRHHQLKAEVKDLIGFTIRKTKEARTKNMQRFFS